MQTAKRVSLFMRGIMLDPGRGTAREIDTDLIDCTTDAGRLSRRAMERLLFRRRSRDDG